jgi:hypothetical protein
VQDSAGNEAVAAVLVEVGPPNAAPASTARASISPVSSATARRPRTRSS